MKKLLAMVLALAMLLSCGALAELEIKTFPEVPENYAAVVDPANPLKTIFSGAYRLECGENRSVVVYLAEGFSQTQGFVMLIPASGMTASQVLEEGGWKAVADEYNLYLMVLEKDGQWDVAPDGEDMAYVKAALKLADTRNYWRQPEGRLYMAGYGDAADIAFECFQAGDLNGYAGIVAFGDLTVDAEKTANGADTEMPVWLFVSELNDNEKSVLDYFKAQNNCAPEAFSSAYADEIYFPNQHTASLLLNNQPMSQVRLTVAADAAAPNADRAAAVYAFLHEGTREVAYGAKSMRYTHDLEDWGATVETLEVGGVTRHWIQYIPSRLRETAEGKAPLLVMTHGAALNGEYFAERTEYIKLAEEFGFIVVFPTGSVAKGITPSWSTNPEDNERNDITFIKEMVEVLKANLPIDTARMYVGGHSNGSGMAQRLIEVMPGTFAACCSTGMLNSKLYNPDAEQVPTPLWCTQGQFDMGATSVNADGAKNWIDLYSGVNHIEGDCMAYRAGRFEQYTWFDGNHVPMLRLTIAGDMPHTSTLDLGYQYVCWMLQFSRAEDGSLVYGGGVYNPN